MLPAKFQNNFKSSIHYDFKKETYFLSSLARELRDDSVQ